MRKRKRNDSNVELAVDDVLCGRKTIDQTSLVKYANLANEQVDDYVDKIRKRVIQVYLLFQILNRLTDRINGNFY